MEIELSAYLDSDYDELVAMWDSCGLSALSAADLRNIVARGGNVILARHGCGDQIVGSTVWTYDGQRAFLRKVAVAPDYRRRGLAQTLLQEAQRQIDCAGIGLAVLMTGEDNHAARSLYAKTGWSVRNKAIEVWQWLPR